MNTKLPVAFLLLCLTAGCMRSDLHLRLHDIEEELLRTDYADTNVWSKIARLRPEVLERDDDSCDALYNGIVASICASSVCEPLLFSTYRDVISGKLSVADESDVGIGHQLRYWGSINAARSAYLNSLREVTQENTVNTYGNVSMEYNRIGLTRESLKYAAIADSYAVALGDSRARLWTARLKYTALMKLGKHVQALDVLKTFNTVLKSIKPNYVWGMTDTVTIANLIREILLHRDSTLHLSIAFGEQLASCRDLYRKVSVVAGHGWPLSRYQGNVAIPAVPKPVIRRFAISDNIPIWADSIVEDRNGNLSYSTRFGVFTNENNEYVLTTPVRPESDLNTMEVGQVPKLDTIYRSNNPIKGVFPLGRDTLIVFSRDSAKILSFNGSRDFILPSYLRCSDKEISAKPVGTSRILITTSSALALIDRNTFFVLSHLDFANSASRASTFIENTITNQLALAIQVLDSATVIVKPPGKNKLYGVSISPTAPHLTFIDIRFKGTVPGLHESGHVSSVYHSSVFSRNKNSIVIHSDVFSYTSLFSDVSRSLSNSICGSPAPHVVLSDGDRFCVIDTSKRLCYSSFQLPVPVGNGRHSEKGIIIDHNNVQHGYTYDNHTICLFRVSQTPRTYAPALWLNDKRLVLNPNHRQTISSEEHSLRVGEQYRFVSTALSTLPLCELYYRFDEESEWSRASNHGRYYSFTVRPTPDDSVLHVFIPLYSMWFDLPITYPFYTRQPFQISVAAVLFVVSVGAIASFLRLRKKVYQARVSALANKQIGLLREDMHDMIGSRLVRIASLARRASSKNDLTAIDRIHDLSVTTVRSLRSLLSLMAESTLDDASFFGLLREYISESCRDAELVCQVSISVGNGTTLTTAQRHELLMIISEMLSNTIRHAQATEVTMTVMKGARNIVVEWSDNGIGIDESSARGNGRDNIERRTNRIGARIAMSSSNNGTSYTIDLPIG